MEKANPFFESALVSINVVGSRRILRVRRGFQEGPGKVSVSLKQIKAVSNNCAQVTMENVLENWSLYHS